MSSIRRRERLRVYKVLQDAADRLTAEIPDRIEIGVSDEEIMFDCITWSSALTRHHFSGETGRRMLSPSDWMAFAEDEVMHLFGGAIDRLKDRWDSAGALDLVRGRDLIDLAPGRMMIDRVLLGMLDSKGIDIRGAGARIATRGQSAWIDDYSGIMGMEMDHGPVIAKHECVGPPVICTSLRVGRATYDGDSLVLDDLPPDTVANASIGRLLGEIIDIGMCALNRRLVTALEVLRPGQHDYLGDPCTRFELAPHLVKLGDTG